MLFLRIMDTMRFSRPLSVALLLVSFLSVSCSSTTPPTLPTSYYKPVNMLVPQPQSPIPTYAPQTIFDSPSEVGYDAPPIHAASYILVNAQSGTVLAARNADTARGAASTQKLLTALIVAEEGNLEKPIRITASDIAVEPTRLGVRPGDVYTRRQLLIGFLVKSANDVANALGRDNAGSVSAFAEKMTARARSLGATHSRFANPHGLTANGQYSTARDMARIAKACYENPYIRDAVKRKYFEFRYANGKSITLKNTNELLGRMPECNGMKTGYTVAAGRCLISSAVGRGRAVILVQMGSKTTYIFNDAATLMRWGISR